VNYEVRSQRYEQLGSNPILTCSGICTHKGQRCSAALWPG